MHKELHLLGLLLAAPRTGYQLHRIVAAHGELFTDLKRGNVYYLLERLAQDGALTVTAEPGARGPRRERLVYTITDRGRRRFLELLRAVVSTYELPPAAVEVGMIFLPHLDPGDAIELLEARRAAVLARHALVEPESGPPDHLHEQLARDHLLCMMDAELAWIARTIERLRRQHSESSAASDSSPPRCSGAPAPSSSA
jgi:DNA-binding PadR family transcriptional regulator